MRSSALVLGLCLLGGCDDPATVTDAAGRDGGLDGSFDAGASADAALIDSGPDAGPLSGYCADLESATCAWFLRCRSASSCDFGPTPGVRRLCQAAIAAEADGRIEVDLASVAACVASMETASCEGPPPLLQTPLTDACARIWTGLVPLGGQCYSASNPTRNECAAGYCRQVDGACPGACAAFRLDSESCGPDLRCAPELYCAADASCAPRHAEGELCNGGDCVAPTACRGTSAGEQRCGVAAASGPCLGDAFCLSNLCVAGTCADAAAIGERCTRDAHCAADASCQRDDTSGMNVCTARSAAGASCDRDSDCLLDLRCLGDADGNDPRCAALGEAGQPCGRACAAGLWCRRDAVDDPGICALLAGEGEDCGDFFDVDPYGRCESGFFCSDVDERCHAPGALDETCVYHLTGTCQRGLWCERGAQRCRAPRAEGEMCNPLFGGACVEGLYCFCGEDTCPAVGDAPSALDVCVPQGTLDDPCRPEFPSCAEGFGCVSDDGDVTYTCQPQPVSEVCDGP